MEAHRRLMGGRTEVLLPKAGRKGERLHLLGGRKEARLNLTGDRKAGDYPAVDPRGYLAESDSTSTFSWLLVTRSRCWEIL